MAEFEVVDLSGENEQPTPTATTPSVSIPMTMYCIVHKHTHPVPTEIHHVWPLGIGGPDIRANKVPLCSDGHGEVHNYLDLLIKYDKLQDNPLRVGTPRVPWHQKIRYGSKVRRVALLGFARYKRGSM